MSWIWGWFSGSTPPGAPLPAPPDGQTAPQPASGAAVSPGQSGPGRPPAAGASSSGAAAAAADMSVSSKLSLAAPLAAPSREPAVAAEEAAGELVAVRSRVSYAAPGSVLVVPLPQHTSLAELGAPSSSSSSSSAAGAAASSSAAAAAGLSSGKGSAQASVSPSSFSSSSTSSAAFQSLPSLSWWGASSSAPSPATTSSLTASVAATAAATAATQASSSSSPTSSSSSAAAGGKPAGSSGRNGHGKGRGNGESLAVHKMELDDLDKTVFMATSGVLFVGIRAFAYPSILVKTRIQIMDAAHAKPPSTMSVYRDVVSKDGVRGLFRGFAPSLLNTGLRQIYLLMYEGLRTNIKRLNDAHGLVSEEHIDLVRDTSSGFLASVAYQVISNPVDVVVQKMMVMPKHVPPAPGVPRSIYDVFPSLALTRDIYRTDGLTAFYRGFVSSSLQYSLSSGIWWGTFTFCMDRLVPADAEKHTIGHPEPTPIQQPGAQRTLAQRAWDEHPWRAQHVSALAAGAASVALTNPIDVCRTRLMVSARKGDSATAWSVFRQLLRDEGAVGLLRGVVPRTVAFAPVSMMTMTVYQVSKLIGFSFKHAADEGDSTL